MTLHQRLIASQAAPATNRTPPPHVATRQGRLRMLAPDEGARIRRWQYESFALNSQLVTGGDRLAKFASRGRLKPYVPNDLIDRTAIDVRLS